MATVSGRTTLDCPLCFKKFTTPRVLPCFHTFCEKCLCAHIESLVQDGSKCTCPLCAAEIVPSDSNLTVDKWAGTFPLNTLVCSLIESLNLEDADVNCESCKATGENINAEFWCTICQEKLCSSCHGLHKRNKLLKSHTIVSIDELQKQFNVNFEQVCSRHVGNVNFFCVDHRKLCCSLCVSTDHRQCNDLRSIDEIAHDESQRSTFDYSGITRDFKQLKTEMEKIITENKTNAKQVLQEKDKILHDMDSRIDRIIDHLNKLKNMLREETDQLYRDTERSILKNEKTLQSFVTNVENSEGIMEVVETSGTPQQKFTTFEIVRSQIASHYDQLKSKLSDGDVEVHFTMKSDKLLDDIEGSLKHLGSVDATTNFSPKSCDAMQNANKIMKNLNSRTKISTEMRAAQVEKIHDLMTSPVTFVKSATREKLGSSAWFTGGTFLGNGRLVMCDTNNDQLVELDDEYNFVKEYKIDCHPADLVAGNKDNEIYLSVFTYVFWSYIYKCTLNSDLTIVSRFRAPSFAWGIAVIDDYVIVGTRDAVVILAQDGSTVKSIPKSGYNSYVAASQTQRTIYHRDVYDIVCRTLEGQEVFRYKHQQLKAPRGMYVDRHNRLYICGKDSHNIHQVSPDGQTSRVIQLHNISKPWSVVLHPRKNHCVVTSWKENTVYEVYKFAP